MLNRRHMLMGGTALALMGGTALAVAAAIANGPRAGIAHARDARAGEDVVAWLKANARPLATAEPGSGFKDLEPLRAVIGDARIVSLGEATHGTREFFQLKHRMIEYCVSELGFTMIGFEAEYGTTLAVNDYVLAGKGNAMDAVTGMGFWTWDTEEVVALVEWVRAWNLAHERKVKFYGFDMQGSAASVLHLLGYLERVAPRLAATCERNLAPLASACTLDEFRELSDDMRETTLGQIKTVLDEFDDRRERWIDRTSEIDWSLARQSAVAVRQFARYKLLDEGDDWTKSFTFRDRAMAANVRSLLDVEGEGAKAVLWAHNGHVQRSSAWDIPGVGPFEMPNMGSFLHKEFGDDHVVVGFAFNQGSFKAVGKSEAGGSNLRDHTVGPAPDAYIDAALAATGVPMFALDLTSVPSRGPVACWMAGKPSQRMIGAVFAGDEAQYAMVADPRDNYDVLLFVDTTTASRGTKRPDFARMVGSGRNGEPTNLALTAGDKVPQGWRAIHRSLYPYAMAAAGEMSPKGGGTMRIARADSPLAWGDGELTQSFPAAPWRGRRLTFSAAMHANAPRIGTGAQLVLHVWPKAKGGDSMASDKPMRTMRSDGIVRSSGWTRQSIAVDVPADAERIQISLVVTGDSAGVFGDLELGSMDALQSMSMRPVMPTHHVAGGRTISIRPAPFRGEPGRIL